MSGARVLLTALVLLAALVTSPAAAQAQRDFDAPASDDTTRKAGPGGVQRQDTPDDPGYDRAENDDEDGGTATSLYSQRFDLFGFASDQTPEAVYKAGPDAGRPMVSGFNAAGAWKLTRGRNDVTVAILDTGTSWDRTSLRAQVALNAGELPAPPSASDDGDGVAEVDDYAALPGLTGDEGPDGVPGTIDAQDLLRRFSDGTDADGNGYVDDIAGWDFFDDDNDALDASSYAAASNHGDGRAREAVEPADDGEGDLGVCPRCRYMPIRTWDTFVSDGNTFALGITYAADNGVEVIEGANGSLYHSAFAEAASEYAYKKGAVQVFSGDDLNTGNHNYPANYTHAMLIQGTATDTIGLGEDVPEQLAPIFGIPGTELPVQTYFRGANKTQFGGKSSLAMEGGTGSQNTGKAAGAAALVISAARERGVELRPDEVRGLLEQTAEDVLPQNTQGTGAPDLANEGWDRHFGWGRADVGAAVDRARRGEIVPEAAITGPDWYAPLTGASVELRGLARARFRPGVTWRLEWGAGHAPATWTSFAQGVGPVDGALGTLDLAPVRAAMAGYTPPLDPGDATFAPGGTHPLKGQFAVRLVVTGEGADTPGIDRKVLTLADDPSLRPGFPRRLGTGGEAAIRYADVDGDGTDELVLPRMDGVLEVLRPDGSNLPGFPVRTEPMDQGLGHEAAPAIKAIGLPREPLRAPVVADLDDDGEVELVATAGRRIYAWSGEGELRPGFPVAIPLANCAPDKQDKETQHPKCGFLSGPAVGRFDGRDQPLGVVAPGLDGRLYGVRRDGSALPGFPVRLQDPGIALEERQTAESINQPAVGDLDGDGRDDVLASTNEVYAAQSPGPGTLQGGPAGVLADALAGAAGGSTRVYAVSGKDGSFLPGWPVALNGGIQDTLPLVGPGHDPSLVRVGGQQRVVLSATGGSLSVHRADGTLERSAQQGTYGPASDATDRTGQLNLFESAAVGDLLGGGTPALVKYGLSLGGAGNLLLDGQNLPYNHLIGAYDAGTGAPLPAWPRVTDDFQFVSSSTVAKVAAGPTNQVLAGTGLGLLHAYDGATGRDVEGFPKVTGGWLYSPATVARDGRVAAITREGYLFEWAVPGAAPCQTEWPSYRHDQQMTGNYDADGTPPGRPEAFSVPATSSRVQRITFTGTGDDGACGAPVRYSLREDGRELASIDLTTSAGRQAARDLELGPVLGRTFTLHAIDEAGNVGPGARSVVPVNATADPPGAPAPGTPGAGPPAGGTAPGTGSGPGSGPGSRPGTTRPGAGPAAGTSCTSGRGFRSVAVRPAGTRVRIGFVRRLQRPVTVDVFAQSAGRRVVGERLVARFSARTRGLTWNGRATRRGRTVADGTYVVRLRMKGDSRRVALLRRGGRWSALRAYERPDACGLVRSAKLERPVFGGRSNRPLRIAFRVGEAARVEVVVRRGRRVVRRTVALRRPGITHRIRVRSERLTRGDHTVTITVRTAGGRRATTTLTATRL